MKGVLLAGGTGSRLLPLTKVTNKHLLPVGGVPMIMHPLRALLSAGIKDIMVVTGAEHAGDIFQLLGSGKRLFHTFNNSSVGVNFTYRVQDEAGGIAQALSLAEDFVGLSTCMVVLGDNIFTESLKFAATEFKRNCSCKAGVVLCKSKTPERFGVVEVDTKTRQVLRVTEKPNSPKSNLIQTGCYFYTCNVFSAIRMLKPSARGELEISDLNQLYADRGWLYYSKLKHPWCDAGTHESYQEANRMFWRKK